MNILETLVRLRDDLKTWVTTNVNALNSKIEEKSIPVDDALSSTSTNPVQNKVINEQIESLNDLVGDTPVKTQISTAIENQDQFSGDYHDLINAPNITEDDSNNVIIVDNNGNKIFQVDAEGIHTTDVEAAGIHLSEKIPEWDAKSDFSGDYNDLENKPDIIEDNAGNLIIVDENGNKIFQVDKDGTQVTNLKATESITIDGKELATTEAIDQAISSLIDGAPEKLDTLNELAEALRDNADIVDVLENSIANKADKSELFSGDYNDLTNAPNITEDGVGNMIIADESGNKIMEVSASGLETTVVTAKKVEANGEDVVEKIDGVEEKLDAHIGDNVRHITATERTAWNNKVDKVEGKDLSTNDFTNEYKDKLDNLENIDFVESDPTVPAWAKAVTKPTYTASEVGALPDTTTLADLTDDTNHRTVTDEEKTIWNNKSDFSGNYADLEGAPNITTDEEDKVLYIVDSDGNIVATIDADGVRTTDIFVGAEGEEQLSVKNDFVTKTELNGKNYLTSIPDNYITEDELNAAITGAKEDASNKDIVILSEAQKNINEVKSYVDDELSKLPSVVNNLTSTSTTDALSAAQGKLLNERIDEVANNGGSGYTLPTASTSTKGGVKIGDFLSMSGEHLGIEPTKQEYGNDYEDYITISNTGTYQLTHPIAEIYSIDSAEGDMSNLQYCTYYPDSNGNLVIEGDWYSEEEIHVTYFSKDYTRSVMGKPVKDSCTITLHAQLETTTLGIAAHYFQDAYSCQVCMDAHQILDNAAYWVGFDVSRIGSGWDLQKIVGYSNGTEYQTKAWYFPNYSNASRPGTYEFYPYMDVNNPNTSWQLEFYFTRQ